MAKEGLASGIIGKQEQENLNEIQELLESKHQIVLYGPPGTGKTYFAKKLAFVKIFDPLKIAGIVLWVLHALNSIPATSDWKASP